MQLAHNGAHKYCKALLTVFSSTMICSERKLTHKNQQCQFFECFSACFCHFQTEMMRYVGSLNTLKLAILNQKPNKCDVTGGARPFLERHDEV